MCDCVPSCFSVEVLDTAEFGGSSGYSSRFRLNFVKSAFVFHWTAVPSNVRIFQERSYICYINLVKVVFI